MSVCATCYQPGLPADGRHDCPGLGEIQVTRQRGRGLIVDTAPPRARMALNVLADSGWGVTVQGVDCINIADQALYQAVAYDPSAAALVLELVEDWRPGPNDSATAGGTCTATLRTAGDRVIRCTRPAGHYVEPEDWHRSTPAREGDPTTWSDLASGATPHRTEPEPAATVCTPIPAATLTQMSEVQPELRQDEPPPGFVPFTPEHFTRRETSDDPLAVEPYRNDRGESAWAFRCWGTSACDGWLSLDHYSQESAERARDRHVAEEHEVKEQVMSTPKRITIEAPNGATVLAARHLDATEGPVQVGSTVDTSARSAITTVLRYIATAHNSRSAPTEEQHTRADNAEDQLRRTRVELEHWQTVTVPELRAERDKARTALREVLAVFATVTSPTSGVPMGYQAPPIHPADMDRWRAALNPTKEQ